MRTSDTANARRFFWGTLFGVFVAAIGSLAQAKEHQNASEFERSILHLTVTRAIPDSDSPWSTQNSDLSGYAGVVIGENKILTLASLVTRAVYIQAQKVDDATKIPLKILFADYESNLAVLAPVDGYKLTGVEILPVGPDIPVGSDVLIVAIENARQLQRVSLRASEIGLREATPGGMSLPVYILSGQSRSACRGDPVIRRGMLVGLCVGVTETQPQAITAGVIAHFLADKLSKKSYRGFGVFGLRFSQVSNPWHRTILKIPAGKGALRVSKIHDTSPFADCLHVDDVLTGVDHQAVDYRGFYKNPHWGSVSLSHYVVSKYAGDPVTIKYLRSGIRGSCRRLLRRYSSQDNLVPGLQSEGPIPHVIFGGLLFRELSADYLSSFGKDWQRQAPPELSFSYFHLNRPTLTRQRIVILAVVLSDPINVGYDRISNAVVSKVNGLPVQSIEDLKLRLKLPGVLRDGLEFAQFDLTDGSQIVVKYDGISEAHRRIAKAYSVSEPSSFLTRASPPL